MEHIYSRYTTGNPSFEGTLRLIHDLIESRLAPGIRRVWVQGSNSGRTNLVFTIFEDGRDYRMEFLTINGFRQFRPSAEDRENEIRLMNEFIERLRKTTLNGVIVYPLSTNSVRERIRKTSLEKYGTEYYFQSKEFLENDEFKLKAKNTRIKNGHIVDDINLEPFLLYKRDCRRVTYRFKKILFENWDGYDYYDNEYIKDNLNLNNTNPSYPTIDHKTSILHGFINGIDVEVIGNINNLCITKRSINCSKSSKCK